MIQAVDIIGRQITEDTDLEVNGLRPVFYNSGQAAVLIYYTVVPPGGSFVLDMGNYIVYTRVPIKFMGAGGKLDFYYGTLKS